MVPTAGLRYATVTGKDPSGATSFPGSDIALQFEVGLDGVTKFANSVQIGSVASGDRPDNPLHIRATADPIKLEGLQDDTDPANKLVVANADGVLKTISSEDLGASPWDNPDGTVANQSSTDIELHRGQCSHRARYIGGRTPLSQPRGRQ